MPVSLRKNWLGYTVALCGVAFVTALFQVGIAEVNSTTVALSFLLVVLAVASTSGLGPAIVCSIAGMLCFNFFFLPPVGTLTIQDPQNWVALVAFLVTAATASQLSAAARHRARDAEERREEVWKLYQLSHAIIATPDSETAVSSIARQVIEVFGFDYCAVFVPEGSRWDRVAIAGNLSADPAPTEIEHSFLTGEIQLPHANVARSGEETAGRVVLTYAPLKFGIRSIGVMVLLSPIIERGTIEAIAGLVALALERARFLKAGDLTIEIAERRVTLSGNEVRLTPKEFDMLRYLAINSGKVVTHRTLLQAVWGSQSTEQTEYLRVFINQLRRKIEPDPQQPRYIITEPWVGYRFDPNGWNALLRSPPQMVRHTCNYYAFLEQQPSLDK